MPDTFVYFAYGSNMLVQRLQERTPSAVSLGRAVLPGYRMRFRGSVDGSGKCNIEPTDNPGDKVHGVLYAIAPEERHILDEYEINYERKDVELTAAGRTVVAETYVMQTTPPLEAPYTWYKNITLGGAEQHGLPEEYIEGIRTVEARQDPDAERNRKHEALLNAV